jgi:putative ATP-binding cassette transporter
MVLKLLKFYKTESDAPAMKMLTMAAISGVSSGVLLAMANSAAELAAEDADISLRIFFMFAIALLLFIYSKKYSLEKSAIEIEGITRKIRVRVAGKVIKSELPPIEKIGSAEIYTTISNQTNLISQSGMIIISACQSAITLVACIIYIAWLSKIAAFTIICGVALGSLLFLSHRKDVIKEFYDSIQKETEFFDSLNHVLNGFKELKVNDKKSDDLFEHLQEIARETEGIKVKTSRKLIADQMFSQVFFYSLIGVVVFVLPTMSSISSDVVLKLTASILFIIGPLDLLVGSIPTFTRTSVAIDNLYKLEETLEVAGNRSDNQKSSIKKFYPFKEISCEQISYSYKDEQGQPLFTLGPIDLSVNHGEILFIVGGNGSGKTTLLKLLTGLYSPHEGKLKLDGKTIDQSSYPNFRQLYSIVFSDFHLFDRLYGLKKIDESRVDKLLKQMQLDEKTEYQDGKFTTIKLSTGQRKRLALIISSMEDKEIYIFDEWTADQDPQFRKYFFENIIKDMQKNGKTIIAITHDDRYFHMADRVIKMEYGKVIEEGH